MKYAICSKKYVNRSRNYGIGNRKYDYLFEHTKRLARVFGVFNCLLEYFMMVEKRNRVPDYNRIRFVSLRSRWTANLSESADGF